MEQKKYRLPTTPWQVIYYDEDKKSWLGLTKIHANSAKLALKKAIEEWWPKQTDLKDSHRGAKIRAFDPEMVDRRPNREVAYLPEGHKRNAMKLTKTQLKEMIREAIRAELDEGALTSGAAIRRKLLDKIRTRRSAEVLVNGQWFMADDASMDPEEPDTLYVLDKDGGDHEIRFTDIEVVK